MSLLQNPGWPLAHLGLPNSTLPGHMCEVVLLGLAEPLGPVGTVLAERGGCFYLAADSFCFFTFFFQPENGLLLPVVLNGNLVSSFCCFLKEEKMRFSTSQTAFIRIFLILNNNAIH